MTGHWELMGSCSIARSRRSRTGFPPELIDAFERRIGRPSLGNVVASGTAIIDELGPRARGDRFPIVYTSADSVFQIAAHEGIVPMPQLYEWCEIAYELAVEGLGLGRRHRAAVRRPAGRVQAHREPPRLRDAAAARDAARPAAARRATGDGDRQDQRICSPAAGSGVAPDQSDDEGMDRVEEQMARRSAG